MQNLIDQNEFDEGSGAASLSRIQVRKPKAATELQSGPAPKAGDITERLALLSKELERNDTPPEPVQNIPPASLRRTEGTPRNTGWGAQKPTPPDILSYWMSIRGSRRYPSWEALQPEIIGIHWPNCVLVHCNKDIGRLQVKYEFTNAVRKVALNNITDEERIDRIEFTPMVIDWILSLGREVSLTGKPTHGTEQFPSLKGEFPLRLIALPLSEDLRHIDHVLCYIQQLR